MFGVAELRRDGSCSEGWSSKRGSLGMVGGWKLSCCVEGGRAYGLYIDGADDGVDAVGAGAGDVVGADCVGFVGMDADDSRVGDDAGALPSKVK